MGEWRYSVGHKGVSRITVFERADATSIFVEWYDDDGRHKAALSTVVGHPITDRDMAMEVAIRMSAAQERKRNQQAAEMIGLPVTHTLTELLEAMHANRSGSWSESYRRDQDRYRLFWLEKLGNVPLVRVNAALAERVVREEAARRVKDPKRRSWSPRTHGAVLRYLKDAYYFAERKLKWINDKQNLSAITAPKAKGRSEAYTLAEARKLLPALESVDWRAGWIGHVALQTGRRLTAIRTLPTKVGWVVMGSEYAVLRFPGETDKARNTGEAVVSGDALRLTERAAQKWRTPPMHECRRWIREAEEAAGIESRHGRGWHGLKRLYATLAKGHVGREKQSGTLGVTLDRVYMQDDLAPKIELARVLAGKVAGV